MSRKRKDNGANHLYAEFMGNSARNREQLYENMYFRVLTELSINRFEWVGMPREIDTRFLELQLYRNGLCVFFHDESYNRFFALQGAGAGRWNMYDNPIAFKVVGNGMYSRDVKSSECVPIWSNALRRPESDIIAVYSTKLAQIERTIEIALNAHRMPFIIAVDENERLTFQNLLREVMDGQPAIFGTRTMLSENGFDDKIKLFQTGVDREIALNLQIAKSKMWNECMTLLGINNANQDKRERLVADEISANDSQVSSVRDISLNARKQAADEINYMFAELLETPISVKWREDVSIPNPPESGMINSIGGDLQ